MSYNLFYIGQASRNFFQKEHFDNTPRIKFMWSATFISNFDDKQYNLFLKSVDRPSIKFDTETVSQYNKKRIIQKRIEYDDVKMVIYDTNDANVWEMFHEYAKHYSNDFRNETSNMWNYDIVSNEFKNDFGFGFSGNKITTDKNWFFKSLILRSFYDNQTYDEIEFVNPVIKSFNPADEDYSNGSSPQEIDITIGYEAIIIKVKEGGTETEVQDVSIQGLRESGGRYIDLENYGRQSSNREIDIDNEIINGIDLERRFSIDQGRTIENSLNNYNNNPEELRQNISLNNRFNDSINGNNYGVVKQPPTTFTPNDSSLSSYITPSYGFSSSDNFTTLNGIPGIVSPAFPGPSNNFDQFGSKMTKTNNLSTDRLLETGLTLGAAVVGQRLSGQKVNTTNQIFETAYSAAQTLGISELNTGIQLTGSIMQIANSRKVPVNAVVSTANVLGGVLLSGEVDDSYNKSSNGVQRGRDLNLSRYVDQNRAGNPVANIPSLFSLAQRNINTGVGANKTGERQDNIKGLNTDTIINKTSTNNGFYRLSD